MFDWILNMPFISNPNQVTGFYLLQILISLQNMFRLHTKNIYTKYTKFASLKKIQRSHIMKRNLELSDLRFLCFSTKTCPDLSEFIQALFQSLYHTFLISPKREIDETVNFRNFHMLFRDKFAAFFVAFQDPIFSNRKNETKCHGYMKHAAMAITCTLGKLM